MQAYNYVWILLLDLRFSALRKDKRIIMSQEQEISIARLKSLTNPVSNTIFRIPVHIHYPSYQIISDQSLIPIKDFAQSIYSAAFSPSISS